MVSDVLASLFSLKLCVEAELVTILLFLFFCIPELFNNKYTQFSIWTVSHFFLICIYSWNDGSWTEKTKPTLALSLLLPLPLDLHKAGGFHLLCSLCAGPLNNRVSEVYLKPVGLLCQQLILLVWIIRGIFLCCAHVAAKIKVWGGTISHWFWELSFLKKKISSIIAIELKV